MARTKDKRVQVWLLDREDEVITKAAEAWGQPKAVFWRTTALAKAYELGITFESSWHYDSVYEELNKVFGEVGYLINMVSREEEEVKWCNDAILDKTEKIMFQLGQIQEKIKLTSQ